MRMVVSVINGNQVFNSLKLNMEDEAALSQLLGDIEEFLLTNYEELQEEEI